MMQTLSEDVGTTPVFQLEAVVHCPGVAVFQLSVQARGRAFALGIAAPAGTASMPSNRTIPAIAVPEIIKALGVDVSFTSEPVEDGTTPPAIAAPPFFPPKLSKLVYHRTPKVSTKRVRSTRFPPEVSLCSSRTVTAAPCATNREVVRGKRCRRNWAENRKLSDCTFSLNAS